MVFLLNLRSWEIESLFYSGIICRFLRKFIFNMHLSWSRLKIDDRTRPYLNNQSTRLPYLGNIRKFYWIPVPQQFPWTSILFNIKNRSSITESSTKPPLSSLATRGLNFTLLWTVSTFPGCKWEHLMAVQLRAVTERLSPGEWNFTMARVQAFVSSLVIP